MSPTVYYDLVPEIPACAHVLRSTSARLTRASRHYRMSCFSPMRVCQCVYADARTGCNTVSERPVERSPRPHRDERIARCNAGKPPRRGCSLRDAALSLSLSLTLTSRPRSHPSPSHQSPSHQPPSHESLNLKPSAQSCQRLHSTPCTPGRPAPAQGQNTACR